MRVSLERAQHGSFRGIGPSPLLLGTRDRQPHLIDSLRRCHSFGNVSDPSARR
jgi:hypothetical protein